jgi:hypothetical protein
MRNKNKIIAVIGPEGQSDLAGFGSTAAAALRDLADKMDARWLTMPAKSSRCARAMTPHQKQLHRFLVWVLFFRKRFLADVDLGRQTPLTRDH